MSFLNLFINIILQNICLTLSQFANYILREAKNIVLAYNNIYIFFKFVFKNSSRKCKIVKFWKIASKLVF